MKGITSSKNKLRMWGIALVLPQLAGFVFFNVLPFLTSIVRALSSGTAQFASLFSSEAFFLALKNTCLFMLIGLPLLFLLVLGIALIMNRMYRDNMRGTGSFMALHLIPMVIPSSVIAFVFKIIFDNHGLLNGALNSMGIPTINWLHSGMAFWVFIIIFLWKNYGYCMIIMLGGIQSVPEETLEAASIDGASYFKTLTHIVLPQMGSYTRFTMLMGIIGIFKMFRESYMMFGNYPNDSIYMMQNFMNNCFYSLNYNRLAAASVVLITILSIVVVIMFVLNADTVGKIKKNSSKGGRS